MSFPCQILKPNRQLSCRTDYRLYWELYTEDEDQELIMPRTFVTFGQNHRHTHGRHVLNADTVAVLECENAQLGRERAFALFGPKFAMEYHEGEWNETQIKYFPKGYVYVDSP